jgi:hypothetical protein
VSRRVKASKQTPTSSPPLTFARSHRSDSILRCLLVSLPPSSVRLTVRSETPPHTDLGFLLQTRPRSSEDSACSRWVTSSSPPAISGGASRPTPVSLTSARECRTPRIPSSPSTFGLAQARRLLADFAFRPPSQLVPLHSGELTR